MSETPTTIHYVDAGHFYSVYGISTMIVVILLMWYFVRTNLESNCRVEGLGGIPIEDPDIMKMIPLPEYKQVTSADVDKAPAPYSHWSGTYGDVPLHIYDVKNLAYKSEWDHSKGIYIPNMRTVYRQTYEPGLFW